jgi:predicted transcriptional regulator
MARKSLVELREEMRSVARGEGKPSPLPAAPLFAALSKESLDLLGTLLREHPATISEVVAMTGRAQSNVSRSLQLLAKLGLVRLVREGREVRPEAVAKTLSVDLASGTYETTPAAEKAA